MITERQLRATEDTFTLNGRTFSHEEVALLAVGAAMDKKAFRPLVMDLRNQGAFTEYFVMLSASNARQANAIAEGVRMFFKNTFGIHPVAVDGLESLTWVLLDYGFMFVHVFQEPTRELYQLEQLWSKGRIVPVSEEPVALLFSEVNAMVQAATAAQEE